MIATSHGAFADGGIAPPADTERAKEAYDRAVVAHKRGDYQRAAQELADADALAPNDVALAAALDAAIDADDPALGAELLDRARRAEPAGGHLAGSIAAARRKLDGRAGRIAVSCPGASTCRATLDGKPMPTKKPTWTRIGTHTVVVTLDGESQTKVVEIRPNQGESLIVTRTSGSAATFASAPLADTPPAPPPRTFDATRGDAARPLPPWVFWVGVAATGAAAVGSTALMLSADAAHGEFEDAGCARAPESGCVALREDGEAAQSRANVMIGVTAAFALATVVIGAAFTDWSGGASRTGTGTGTARVAPGVLPRAGGGFGAAVVRF